MTTFEGLGDAYFNLSDFPKAKHYILEAIDVVKKIGTKEDHFEIHTQLKLVECETITEENMKEIFARFDEIEDKIDSAAKMVP